jgi:hypothetical protein
MIVNQIGVDTYTVQAVAGKPVAGVWVVRKGVCSCGQTGCVHLKEVARKGVKKR